MFFIYSKIVELFNLKVQSIVCVEILNGEDWFDCITIIVSLHEFAIQFNNLLLFFAWVCLACVVIFCRGNGFDLKIFYYGLSEGFAFLLRSVEKEFIILDDSLLFFSTFVLLFGWFFFIAIVPFFFKMNCFLMSCLTLPIVVLLTIVVPVHIVWDYGAQFVVYLRGAVASAVFIIEFLYDIINIFILFLRVVIQNIRFGFMAVVWSEMQEHNVCDDVIEWFLPLADSFLGVRGNYIYKPSTVVWLIVFKMPLSVYVYGYYILHMVVVCSINFFAYVLLVFWLYFYFYTNFYTVKFEKFFKKKTAKR